MASELMKEKEVRHIPIVDANNFPVGIISQRDIFRAQDSELMDSNQQKLDSKSILLKDIMSNEISYTSPKDPLRSACLKLQKNKYG